MSFVFIPNIVDSWWHVFIPENFAEHNVTGDFTDTLFLQSEPTLSQNLLVDPCLVQVTDHCISMPSVVYSQMCLIGFSQYMDHIFKGSCRLVVPPNVFLWWNWTNNLGNRKFPSIASDTCWNICKWIQHRSLWLDAPSTPLAPGVWAIILYCAGNVCTPL